VSDDRPTDEPRLRPERRGCGAVLIVVAGAILLLPGICVVITAAITLPDLVRSVLFDRPSDPYFWPLIAGWLVFWLICLLISCLGIYLIRRSRS
jgi:hypothetical protein